MSDCGRNVGKPLDDHIVTITTPHPDGSGRFIETTVREMRELRDPAFVGDHRTVDQKWIDKHWDEKERKEK